MVVGSVASGGQVLAAAASAAMVADIAAAVAAVGWSLGVIVPAHAAWAAAVRDGQAVVRLAHGTEVLRVVGGRMVERRRVRTALASRARLPQPFSDPPPHV